MPTPLVFLAVIVGVPLLGAFVYVFVTGRPSTRRYLVARAALAVPMVLILASLVFFILRVIPGDPVDSELFFQVGPAERERIRTELGLNDPLLTQYVRFLGQIAVLDFGNSLTGAERPVIDEIAERFPATVELVIPAAAVAILVGVFVGTVAARRRRSASDFGLRLASVVATAMPIFWVGLLLQLFFGVALGWAPVSGRIDPIVGTTLDRTTNMLTVDALITGNWSALASALHHLVLPVLAIAIVLAGTYVRLTRINVIESLHEDYIDAARARGIGPTRTVYGYGLKNALIPIVTLMGLQIAILLGGAVLTETVFSWPGMGRYLVERISARDFTAVQGGIVMFAFVVAVTSLLIDVVYSLLDPRIRL